MGKKGETGVPCATAEHVLVGHHRFLAYSWTSFGIVNTDPMDSGLKDEPSLQSTHHLNYSKGVSPQNSASDSSRPTLTWPTNNNKKTRASVSKYQSLLGHTDEASDHSIRVMAAGLSLDKSTGPHLPSIDSSFEQFQMEVTKQVVKSLSVNCTSTGESSTEDDSLESLLVPDQQGHLQFLDSRLNSRKRTRALITVSSLIKAASNLEIRLHDLSPSQTPVEIQSILGTVEDGAETLRQQIASDGSAIVSEEAQKLGAMLDSVEQTVQIWRQEYPDTSPVKINNRKCFFDPAADKNTPTVIAYCIALVARVFERTAQRGATFLLKMLKLFGYSFATLGGRSLSCEQEAVLASIPESIEHLEKKFNLDIECVPYAVCPKCSCTYTPSYPNNTPNPVYPPLCLERKAASKNPCNEPLLSHGKPLKIFEYYPFFDWFGKFISLPGIEEYGDKFCKNIDKHLIVPLNKVHQTDGRFVHEFCGVDGQPFIAGRGNEGRWFFTLNADFFNVEGNRIRGKTSSTGMMAMSCLNLPLNIRNDHAYLYIPGIIQGPHEPNAVDAEYRHYLKPLIDDFLVGYMRGVRPYATH
ncbi:hypothetical protein HHX47_DHR3000330 [Lentinula edodes]|nr:hypothetical protein HHX47_DHR3000330 [Lentinula edodes]